MKKKEGIIYKINLENTYENGMHIGIMKTEYQNITDTNVVLKNKSSLFPRSQLDKISFHSGYDRSFSGCNTNSLLDFELEVFTLDEELVEGYKGLLIKKSDEILNNLIDKHNQNMINIQYDDEEYSKYGVYFRGTHESRIFND